VPFDFLEKKRIDSYTVKIEPKVLDVKDKSVAIVDDVISTGGTIATATKELRKQGARRVVAACVHGLFVNKAEENLKACDDVIATDTIQSKFTKVSVAPEFAAAIRALGCRSDRSVGLHREGEQQAGPHEQPDVLHVARALRS